MTKKLLLHDKYRHDHIDIILFFVVKIKNFNLILYTEHLCLIYFISRFSLHLSVAPCIKNSVLDKWKVFYKNHNNYLPFLLTYLNKIFLFCGSCIIVLSRFVPLLTVMTSIRQIFQSILGSALHILKCNMCQSRSLNE